MSRPTRYDAARRDRQRPGWPVAAALCFSAVALALWAVVFDDYGLTWDETPQILLGEAVRRYFAGEIGVEALAAPLIVPNTVYYSPALDLSCAILAHALRMDVVVVRHAVLGLVWVAMFWPVCAVGRRLAGPSGSWFAGLGLLGLPSLLGHAFNNSKDLPLAAATAWLLCATSWASAARAPAWRQALGMGLAFGGVLVARPGAWFLGALVGLVVLSRALSAWRRPGHAPATPLASSVRGAAGALVLAWVLMIAVWPHALRSPFGHPLRSAELARRFDETYLVLFRGDVLTSTALPWDYLFTYVMLTVPLPLTFLALWGSVRSVRRAREKRSVVVPVAAVVFVLWFPLLYFVVARPNVYDGMRHFLFVLPALALMAGVGAADLARRLRPVLTRRGATLSCGALLLSAAPSMIRLHPYQNAYYNVLAGDRSTLHERFETDYWVSSYREAAHFVNDEQTRSRRPLTVALFGNEFLGPAFLDYLAPGARVIFVATAAEMGSLERTGQVDYYVSTVRYGAWRGFQSYPIARRIERDGVVMAVIRGRGPHPVR